MKVSDFRRRRRTGKYREDVYIDTAPAPRPAPFVLDLGPDDGDLVRGLKRAWLPEGAWYLIACAFAKQLEARMRSDHARALNEDVARFRLALANPGVATAPLAPFLERDQSQPWSGPPGWPDWYLTLSRVVKPGRGPAVKSSLSRDEFRERYRRASAALKGEGGGPWPRKERQERLARVLAAVLDFPGADEWATGLTKRLPEETVNEIGAAEGRREAATLVVSLLSGLTPESIARKKIPGRRPAQ